MSVWIRAFPPCFCKDDVHIVSTVRASATCAAILGGRGDARCDVSTACTTSCPIIKFFRLQNNNLSQKLTMSIFTIFVPFFTIFQKSGLKRRFLMPFLHNWHF